MHDATDPFVNVTSVGDPMAARVAAALLGSAGIDARLRGEAFGPYPVTVGRMAVTEIWVRRSDVDEARYILEEAEVSPLAQDDASGEERVGVVPSVRLVALVTGAVLLAAVVISLMRVF